jgi:hypothetical protein
MSIRSQQEIKLGFGVLQWWKTRRKDNGFWWTLRDLSIVLWEFARESTPGRKKQRYGDVDYDWNHRVDTTSATVGWRERLLGALYSPYQPTDELLFRRMLDDLKIDFREFVFIDLGSGKGRTLLMASDYPFRHILGVELLPALHQIAEQNIALYKSASQLCYKLESVCADAREFVFPAESTVLYLFNPLTIQGLVKVLDNLEQSLRLAARPVYVLYHNPEHEHLFIERTFLRKVGSTHQYSLYSN